MSGLRDTIQRLASEGWTIGGSELSLRGFSTWRVTPRAITPLRAPDPLQMSEPRRREVERIIAEHRRARR